MLRKEFIIGALSALLIFGFFGTSFAGSIGSEAGAEIVTSAKALNAALNHNYDQKSLALASSEAGNWKFDFNAPQTSADVAAANYDYDERKLDAIGTEGGIERFNGSSVPVFCSVC